MEAGARIVVDATFRLAADRRTFATALGVAEAPVFIECRAPASVLAERAGRRTGDPQRVSDADEAVVARHIREWESLEELPADRRIAVATDRPIADVVNAVGENLDELLQRA